MGEDGPQLELAKLEYEKCAERYENLYKSIWTQFNYSLLAAGAILTFGKEHYPWPLLALGAMLCLIFWYWATYEPLNGYGDKVSIRAAEIECVATERFFLGASVPTAQSSYHREAFNDKVPRIGMYHFTDFLKGRTDKQAFKIIDWLWWLVLLVALGLALISIYHIDVPGSILGSSAILICLFAAGVCSWATCLLYYRVSLGRVSEEESTRNRIPRVRTTVRLVFIGLHFGGAFLLAHILFNHVTDSNSSEVIKITVSDRSPDERAAGLREAISTLKNEVEKSAGAGNRAEQSTGVSNLQQARRELQYLKEQTKANTELLERIEKRLR